MAKIDAYDRRLLFELGNNARQSLSELARRVKLGRDLVSYRVRRLEDEGVILKYSAVVNPYRLGFTLYKLYVRLRNSPARVKAFTQKLRKHERVFCVADCDGSWDILCNILANSPFELKRLLDELLLEFHDIVLARNISTVINHWYFARAYLGKSPGASWHVGGEPQRIECDEIELRLIEALCVDARLSVVELARAVNCTPIMAKARLERLEQTGVLLGYKLELDRLKLGRTYFKARIIDLDQRQGDTAKLLEFSRKHPDIVYFIEQIGDCPLELAVEAENYEHFNSILDELRREFQQLIGSVETVLVRNDEYRWLPLGAFGLS